MDMENKPAETKKGMKPLAVFAAVAGIGIISAGVYLINFKIFQIFPVFSGLMGHQSYVCMFLFLSVLYLAGVFLVLKWIPTETKPWPLAGVIVLFALLFRLPLIIQAPTVLSKDMYRYIWDGRVQQSGINPYRHPPDAEALAGLRDDQIYPKLNRKDQPTIYPAGAQIFFRIFYRLVGDSVIGYKGLAAGFDMMTLLVLAGLLRAHQLHVSRIIVYAWNPLVVFEISYSGHLEGLTIFFVTSALYLYTTGRKRSGIVILALSTAIKLYPGILIAALVNRGDRIQGTGIFLVTLLLLYLPFLGAGVKIAGFLPVYLKNPFEAFNLGLKFLLMRLHTGLDYFLLSVVFLSAVIVTVAIVFFREKKGNEKTLHAYFLTGLLIILMPAALHPWYVIMIIPFLAVHPSPAWLLFTITVCLSYLKYASPGGVMPTWVLLAEYLPLFLLLAAAFVARKLLKKVPPHHIDNGEKGEKWQKGLNESEKTGSRQLAVH